MKVVRNEKEPLSLTISQDIQSVIDQLKYLNSNYPNKDTLVPVFVISRESDDLHKSELICTIKLSDLLLTHEGVNDMCHKLLLITKNDKRIPDLDSNYAKYRKNAVEKVHQFLVKNIK